MRDEGATDYKQCARWRVVGATRDARGKLTPRKVQCTGHAVDGAYCALHVRGPKSSGAAGASKRWREVKAARALAAAVVARFEDEVDEELGPHIAEYLASRRA